MDVTNSVIDGSTLVNLPGQVCVADPSDHCVRTNWRFQRNGYLVVRRRMPAVDAFTLCFAIQLNSQRLRGTLTTYRQGASVLLMRTDDGGNLKVGEKRTLTFLRVLTDLYRRSLYKGENFGSFYPKLDHARINVRAHMTDMTVKMCLYPEQTLDIRRIVFFLDRKSLIQVFSGYLSHGIGFSFLG